MLQGLQQIRQAQRSCCVLQHRVLDQVGATHPNLPRENVLALQQSEGGQLDEDNLSMHVTQNGKILPV